MKDFYPIYKSKLEPWIKFWILKGNKIAPKVLSEVIEGTTPITIEGVYKGTSLQDLIFKGQTVQEGTPSPEAPIPVQVVKEDNIITINEGSFRVDLKGNNLYKGFSFSKTSSGITFTYNTDGTIKVNGTASSNVTSMYSSEATSYLFTLSSGTYTLSGEGLTANVRIEIVKSNGTLLAQTDDNLYKNFTINEDTNVFLRVYIASGTIVDNLFIYPMLNKGSTALPYEPYYNYELCKIGNYQDRIYKENDKWYVEKKIGKVIYNGTENWSLQRSGTANWYYRLTSAVTNFNYDNDNSNYLSNITIKASIGTSTTVEGMFLTSASELRIRNTTEDTIANWKSFLTTTNMLLYYPLLTPTTSEITDETLLSQLEAIKNETLISGTNEITQTPSDLPFILNFKYYMKG